MSIAGPIAWSAFQYSGTAGELLIDSEIAAREMDQWVKPQHRPHDGDGQIGQRITADDVHTFVREDQRPFLAGVAPLKIWGKHDLRRKDAHDNRPDVPRFRYPLPVVAMLQRAQPTDERTLLVPLDEHEEPAPYDPADDKPFTQIDVALTAPRVRQRQLRNGEPKWRAGRQYSFRGHDAERRCGQERADGRQRHERPCGIRDFRS